MVTPFIEDQGVGGILLNGQVARVDEDFPKRWPPLLCQCMRGQGARIAVHVNSVCTGTPKKFEITFDVCFPNGWFYIDLSYFDNFPFPEKMTIFNVNYMFEVPAGSRRSWSLFILGCSWVRYGSKNADSGHQVQRGQWRGDVWHHEHLGWFLDCEFCWMAAIAQNQSRKGISKCLCFF